MAKVHSVVKIALVATSVLTVDGVKACSHANVITHLALNTVGRECGYDSLIVTCSGQGIRSHLIGALNDRRCALLHNARPSGYRECLSRQGPQAVHVRDAG